MRGGGQKGQGRNRQTSGGPNSDPAPVTLPSSIPAEEQAEFKQLSDDIQELQQALNQDFRQKTVLSGLLRDHGPHPIPHESLMSSWSLVRAVLSPQCSVAFPASQGCLIGQQSGARPRVSCLAPFPDRAAGGERTKESRHFRENQAPGEQWLRDGPLGSGFWATLQGEPTGAENESQKETLCPV